MAVTDTLRELREQVEQNLSEMKDTAALDALRVKVLGKKGTLTELLKGMGKLAPEERPKVGAQINEARQWLTERMNERQDVLQKMEREAALKAETIDVTEPRRPVKVGSAHPITLVMDELIDCFTGLGFEVMEGPEVELDHYNFELMNLPKNHPGPGRAGYLLYGRQHCAAHPYQPHAGPRYADPQAAHPHHLPRPRVPRRRGGRDPQPRVPSDGGAGGG